MTSSKAAVLEPNASLHKKLRHALTKAGLKVTSASAVEALTSESVVFLGPSVTKPAPLTRQLRESHPAAFVVALKKQGFRAPHADAVLPLPVSVPDVKARLADWEKLRSGRKDGASLQSGDGFYPFQTFKEMLFVEIKRARRYGLPVSLALVSNEALPAASKQGVNDAVQKALALAIRRTLRDIDFAVSYAPNKILLLMPHTELAGALTVSQRIIDRVSRTTIEVDGHWVSPKVAIGASAGAVGVDFSFAELVKKATRALEVAQQAGGNRVEFETSLVAEN